MCHILQNISVLGALVSPCNTVTILATNFTYPNNLNNDLLILNPLIKTSLLIVIRWNQSQFSAHQNLLPWLVSPTSKYLNSLEDVQNKLVCVV